MNRIIRLSARRLLAAALPVSALALAGCTDFNRAVGWEKAQPDEFQVVQQAPLEQPPDFYLRPPVPGASRPNDSTANAQAQALLTGNAPPTSDQTGLSPGEQALLARAGADDVPADIRQKVDAQTTALVRADDSLVDKLMFWRSTPQPGQVIDPNQAAAALRRNPGAVPDIERKSSGLF